jgi:hypothetical protein
MSRDLKNQEPSGALTSKRRHSKIKSKNGLSFKSPKRETESKRLNVLRKNY